MKRAYTRRRRNWSASMYSCTGTTANPVEFGKKLRAVQWRRPEAVMIDNRGVKVCPDGFAETFCTDHWRAASDPAGERTRYRTRRS